jgi:hypothetical protein
MSLCGRCGLDLDTGMQVNLEEDLDVVSAPSRGQPIPIGVAVVGGISLLGSLVLGAVSLVRGTDGSKGFLFLFLVCVFGVVASVQFLRGKSAKPLLIALSLGALIDIVALIALPIWQANEPEEPGLSVVVSNADEDDTVPVIRPYTERLDLTSISWGIALLLIYAMVSVYISTPSVRRHMTKN